MRKKRKRVKTGDSLSQKIRRDVLPPKLHELGEKPCIIVDGMHLAYRVKYTHKNLSYRGKRTGVMFGFLTVIKSLILLEHPEKIIVCWDGERHPERLKLLPDYKGHRVKDPQEMKLFHKEISRLKKLLNFLGVQQAHNSQMEGDDMVYWVTKKMVNSFPILIYSGDKDFKQLINQDIRVINPREKYACSHHTFLIDHSVNIYQFVDYLALIGDDSDDIPGYRGIGPARAKAFFQKYKSIKEYLDSEDEYSGLLDKDKLREIWKRNRMLMDLKRFNEKYHKPEDVTYYKGKQFPELNIIGFKAMAAKYGLLTFLTDTFQKPFIQLWQS